MGSLGGKVTALDFPNAQDGFAVVCNPLDGGAFSLMESTDGGRSWRARGALPDARAGDISGLWMASASRGLLLTTSGGSACYNEDGSSPGRLWSTTNGGLTWRDVAPVPVGEGLVAASFVPVAAGRWAGWAEGVQAEPFTTSDTGRTWVSRPAFPMLSEVQLVTQDVLVGEEWTSGPVFWYSSDGGRHWRSRPLPGGPHDVGQLCFASAADGWWVASGDVNGVWSTADGGVHWDLVSAA
jgi:photosystem II stability/assembly factor-like uncharacterized protein